MGGLLGLSTGLITLLIGLPWITVLVLPIIALFGVLALPIVIAAAFSLRASQKLTEVRRRLSVLVADDDEVSVTPLVQALARNEVDVQFVENGRSALRELENKKFDLVFMDMKMPELSGEETLREGDRLLNLSKTLPVIFFTSHRRAIESLKDASWRSFKIEGIWEKGLSYLSLTRRLEPVIADINRARMVN